MNTSYKPDQYNSVSPYMLVKDSAALIKFMEHVFGTQELRRFSSAVGKVEHAEVRIDDTIVMLADSSAASTAHVHVYVSDVDDIYQRAVDAGAASVQPPEKKDDADKRSGVQDPSGITWWIATRVE